MGAISSLGVGSGLDLGSLVSGLIEAERAPTANRLAFKEQNLTAELSAFGLLRSSLSQFQSSLSGLQSATAFDAKDVSLSNDSVFSTSVENFADAGSYSVEVTALAKAQSLASSAATAFTSVDDVIGEGTMTIQFGTTSTGPYSFTPDSGQGPQAIAVSAANGNNTLSGLRDYINDNDFNVLASVVNDGNGYRLVLISERTGASNSMEITVSGDGDGDDNDNSGLSQLAFNASAQTGMLQTVSAQDAALSINGLEITRDRNSVTGAINGVTLDLLKADIGNVVSVDISESRAQVTASINGFVGAYNELMVHIDSLTAYNPETNSGSILIGDFTVRSISSQIRNEVFGRVSGLNGNIKSLVDIGITTNSSGTLDVDGSKLKDALTNYGSEVAALFSVQGESSDAGVRYLSASAETVAGQYAINVSSVATSGSLTAAGNVTTLDIDANNDGLSLLIDGVSTGALSLTQGSYVSEAALASEIQTRINTASTMVAASLSVSVSYDVPGDRFVITSDSVGSASTVEITAIDVNTNLDFGFSLGSGVAGNDLVASIDNGPTSVDDSIITSQFGNSKGLALEILTPGSGSRGIVTLTRGLASNLDSILDRFLQAEGFIASRESSINESLEDVEDERFKLDDRITALEARLVRQFSALDAMVAQFNQTSSFLSLQLDNLPKPNSIGGNR